MDQWLRIRTPNAGGVGFIPGQGTRPHVPRGQQQQKEVHTHCAYGTGSYPPPPRGFWGLDTDPVSTCAAMTWAISPSPAPQSPRHLSETCPLATPAVVMSRQHPNCSPVLTPIWGPGLQHSLGRTVVHCLQPVSCLLPPVPPPHAPIQLCSDHHTLTTPSCPAPSPI